MTGKNLELAQETQRVLAAHGKNGRPLSLRAAEQRTQVSYSTIQNMTFGRPNIKPENLIRFAVAFGEDSARWLQMCGYSPASYNPLPESNDPDIGELIRAYIRVPTEKRPIARKVIVDILTLIT